MDNLKALLEELDALEEELQYMLEHAELFEDFEFREIYEEINYIKRRL